MLRAGAKLFRAIAPHTSKLSSISVRACSHGTPMNPGVFHPLTILEKFGRNLCPSPIFAKSNPILQPLLAVHPTVVGETLIFNPVSDSLVIPDIISWEALNRNARRPKKANHGKRPCSHVRRRSKRLR